MRLSASQNVSSRRLWMIPVAAMLIMGVGTFVVTTLLPKWYRSDASLYFPSSGDPTSGSTLQSLANMARTGAAVEKNGGVSLFGGALTSPQVASGPQTAIAVLSTLSCRKQVADQLNLQKRWDMPPDMPWRVWGKLESSVTFGVDKNGLLAIEAADQDPQLAADIVNAYIKNLRDLAKKFSINVASRNREFLEKRQANTMGEIRKREAALLREQKSDPDAPVVLGGAGEAAKAVVSLEQELTKAQVELDAVNGQLGFQSQATRNAVKAGSNMPVHTDFARAQRARVATLEYDFAVAKDLFGPDNARYKQIQGELQAARLQLKQEIARESRALESGIAPEVVMLRAQQASLQAQTDGLSRAVQSTRARLAGMPERMMRREKLTQEIKVLRDLYGYQSMETEKARIAEDRDTTVFQVWDEPEPAPLPFMPRRGFSTALAAFAGLLIGIAYLVARSVARQAARIVPDPVPQAVIHD